MWSRRKALLQTLKRWSKFAPGPPGRFLGLSSYYRRCIPDFSSIAKPLYKLTEAKAEFAWTEQCQLAFDSLRGLLTSGIVLAYRAREGEFVLDTDASDHGIGAVLSQFQDGVEKPIAFASRTLSKSERNYCVTRCELLATYKVQDSAFELILPLCVLLSRPKIPRDSLHVGLIT